MNEFFAHTRPTCPPSEWEPLEDHLEAVSRLAGAFAHDLGAADWAELAGLWHDLGKYRGAFQRYLHTASERSDVGSEECAPGRVDHSTVGAVHAMEAFQDLGKPLAYLIAGHHAGLPDASGGGASLSSRLSQTALLDDWHRELIPPGTLMRSRPQTKPPSRDPKQLHFWIRFLFSCLTDADFLATESFMDPAKAASRPAPLPSMASLCQQLRAYLDQRFAGCDGELARLRASIRDACTAGASHVPGLFTLTVPTGGGKTLSSVAFALEHARLWGKRRVIYVIPYTSIIEQTADIFREILGPASVLEHHSNLDPDDERRDSLSSRLAAENWDAPLVVTTNVQFFESLFAARSSRCRKLHNIVNSVVVLDEAQLLPPDFLDPIRQSIEALTKDYGVSLVVSTATQPALEMVGARELARDPADLDRRLRRVRYEWPSSQEPVPWDVLAGELARLQQVLCIVNRRDDARDLFALLRTQPGAEHLSALMCGAHRSERLGAIKEALKAGKPVRLVSTQLVEAGVDFDFPVVYRAFAGLDSIAQAAGRCNREGNLPELGRVVVFNAPTSPPPGLLRKAESKARELLGGRAPEHLEPELFTSYFRLLYRQGVNSLDRHQILDLLAADPRRLDIQFKTAANNFRLVDDSSYRPVLVDWKHGAELIQAIRRSGVNRSLMRRAQRYVVNLPIWQVAELERNKDIEELVPGLFSVVSPRLYDSQTGLRTQGPEYAPEDWIS